MIDRTGESLGTKGYGVRILVGQHRAEVGARRQGGAQVHHIASVAKRRLEGGVKEDFVECAAQDIPSVVGDLLKVFISTHQGNPEVVFPFWTMKHDTLFDRIALCFDRRAKPKVVERKGGRAG